MLKYAIKPNKKGISPLIASVLLIAFTMVLGAIVMNFSESSTMQLKDQASDKIEHGLKCSLDLSLNILEINGEKYICYNRTGSNNLEVIVENQGGASAKGVRIFLLDYYDSPKTIDVYKTLGSHNITKYNVSIALTDDLSTFILPPNKVLISPIIDYSEGSVDICTDNRIDIDEIEGCE
jgi:flagellin-like protein